MNTIKKFLLEHALTIMLLGFSLFFLSFLAILFAGRNSNSMLKQVATTAAITGFSIYVIGRASLFFYNRKKKMHPESTDEL